jgi:hypothetical protein
VFRDMARLAQDDDHQSLVQVGVVTFQPVGRATVFAFFEDGIGAPRLRSRCVRQHQAFSP